MALRYVIATTSFATLCSLVWLLMGGTALQALGLYVLSGQAAMLALVVRAYLAFRASHDAQPS